MIIAQNAFRDEEFLEPKELFEKEGFQVIVAAPQKGLCKGMLGVVVEATHAISEITLDGVRAVVVIGGVGSPTLMDVSALGDLLRSAKEKKLLIGAICLAPMVVASFDILSDMHATVYKTDESLMVLKKHHVHFIDEPVIVDDWLVTGNGPTAAEKFAESIVELL